MAHKDFDDLSSLLHKVQITREKELKEIIEIPLTLETMDEEVVEEVDEEVFTPLM